GDTTLTLGWRDALLVLSVVSFVTRGLNYGIDFEGGVLVEVSAEHKINMDEMRSTLSFLKELSIQSIGLEGKSVLIQTQAEGEGQSGAAVVAQIKEALGSGYTYDRVETIGPRIGQELKEKSLLASVLALLAISVYIWFRFEWPFAIGCMISLAYNLIVVVGFFALFGWEFDMIVVAGLLSLAGYACNDTIVTYDRVRENLQKFHKMPKDELLNKSINETLSRTILTGLTTLFVLLVLLAIGGKTLQGFSISMSLGLIIGTYASIFLAVPMLRYFDIHQISVKGAEVGPFAGAEK
ncbi:MAG: protein translocase subunit SecF, partial [Alphaproteobacteria bacterium]